MENIDDLLRKRKQLLEDIDAEIRAAFTKAVTLLFTDIVGSTQFFEQMGDIAGRSMITTHNDLLFPVIAVHGGTVIKTIGDSIMASFSDPAAAVICAVEMQRSLAAYNRKQTEQHRILVRMGLHFGEAVVDEKDLFGDMVNACARVEAKAGAGEIFISAQLKEKIDDAGIPTVFLGSEPVKGKKQILDIHLVNWNGRSEEEIRSSWMSRAAASSPGTRAAASGGGVNVSIRGNIDLVQAAKNCPAPRQRGNPYLNRVMLPHPGLFYGRQALVKRIIGRIGAEKPQSVSLVGERRIGKSSLLNYLNFAPTRLSLLESAEKYIFLFIDFQQLRATDPHQIIGVIFRELEKSLGDRIEINLPTDFGGLQRLIEAIRDSGFRFILFFDEFESVTKNEQIRPDFYAGLRSLANSYPLAFVTASGRNLKDMCVTREISDSPFFNIFALHNVGLFREDEAKELISLPSARAGFPLESLATDIIADAGTYPFFLQMLCASWHDYLEAEGAQAGEFAGKKMPREVLANFREEAEPHFEFIAESFTADETALVKAVLAEKDVDAASPAAEQLVRRGYLVEASRGGLAPFGVQFGLFLKKYFL